MPQRPFYVVAYQRRRNWRAVWCGVLAALVFIAGLTMSLSFLVSLLLGAVTGAGVYLMRRAA